MIMEGGSFFANGMIKSEIMLTNNRKIFNNVT